jgi:hypothetical protein
MTDKGYVAVTGLEQGSLVTSISDTFTEGTLNGSTWTAFTSLSGYYAQLADSELQIVLAGNSSAQWAGIVSNSAYDITGIEAIVEVSAFGDSTNPSGNTQCSLSLSCNQPSSGGAGGDDVTAIINQDGLELRYGATTNDFSFDSSTQSWLRIREWGGTVYWDTSPDGSTWTNIMTAATSAVVTALDTSSVYAVLKGYTYYTIGSTLGFNDFTLGYFGPAVGISALVVSSGGTVSQVINQGVDFDYDDSTEKIRGDIVAAVQSAASDDTLDVAFVQ